MQLGNVFEQGWRLPYGPQMSAQPVGRRMNSDQPKRLGCFQLRAHESHLSVSSLAEMSVGGKCQGRHMRQPHTLCDVRIIHGIQMPTRRLDPAHALVPAITAKMSHATNGSPAGQRAPSHPSDRGSSRPLRLTRIISSKNSGSRQLQEDGSAAQIRLER